MKGLSSETSANWSQHFRRPSHWDDDGTAALLAQSGQVELERSEAMTSYPSFSDLRLMHIKILLSHGINQ